MKYVSILGALLVFLACGEGKQAAVETESDPIQTLKDQAIAIHDEVMPKMGTLKSLQKQLNDNKEALLAKGKTESEISDMVVQLMKADDGMMAWMRDYNTQVTRAKANPTPAILEAQIESIKEVQTLTNSAIQHAQESLQLLAK